MSPEPKQSRGHSPKPMNAHLVLIIAQTTQGIKKSHIGNAPGSALRAGENQLISSSQTIKLLKELLNLTSQRDHMDFLHFHALRRNGPQSLLKIYFLPPCSPQLLRTNKNIRKDAQGVFYGEAAIILLQCPEKLTYLLWISNCRRCWTDPPEDNPAIISEAALCFTYPQATA